MAEPAGDWPEMRGKPMGNHNMRLPERFYDGLVMCFFIFWHYFCFYTVKFLKFGEKAIVTQYRCLRLIKGGLDEEKK